MDFYFDSDTHVPMELTVDSKYVDFTMPTTYGLNHVTGEQFMKWLDFNESLVPKIWKGHIYDLNEYDILMSIYIRMKAGY